MVLNDSDSQSASSRPSLQAGLAALKAYLARICGGEFLRVSEARKTVVLEDIVQGSTPRVIYYVLLGLSTLIAGFGLVASSPAVVIGAMLVSPLMTPTFGISLSLSRGNLQLLRDACVAEFGGVVLAIGLGWLLGLLPIAFNATPEMLARTSPTLIDLFVATLAGLAGCLAMIDERISPALPGILVPVGGGAALGSAATSAVVSGTLNVGQEVGPENLRTMAKKTAKAIIKDVSPRIYELGWPPPTKAR